jgi:DNA-3-methyladenine glycosylase II
VRKVRLLSVTLNGKRNMKRALEHLRQDEKLGKIIDEVGLRIPKQHPDVYFTLLRSIVEQQLSLKAAATIWKRFLNLFDDYPHPNNILNHDDDYLKSCGLSYQKVNYIKNIARFAIEKDLSDSYVNALNDDEVLKYLTQIKGVGRWTTEMILMFSMGRKNVFPVDDLVIRKAMISLYGVQSQNRALIQELEAIAEGWMPYRSYACFVLWDWKDGK